MERIATTALPLLRLQPRLVHRNLKGTINPALPRYADSVRNEGSYHRFTGSAPAEQPRNHRLILFALRARLPYQSMPMSSAGLRSSTHVQSCRTDRLPTAPLLSMGKVDQDSCLGNRPLLAVKGVALKEEVVRHRTDRLTYVVDDRVVVPTCATIGEYCRLERSHSLGLIHSAPSYLQWVQSASRNTHQIVLESIAIPSLPPNSSPSTKSNLP